MKLNLKSNAIDRLRLASILDGISFLVLLGIVGLGVAFGVAHMKNLYHDKEGQKLALREEIADLELQTEMLENEFQKECSPERVRARTVANGSSLRPIPQGSVIQVDSPSSSSSSVSMR
jgi:hypothetical protein